MILSEYIALDSVVWYKKFKKPVHMFHKLMFAIFLVNCNRSISIPLFLNLLFLLFLYCIEPISEFHLFLLDAIPDENIFL